MYVECGEPTSALGTRCSAAVRAFCWSRASLHHASGDDNQCIGAAKRAQNTPVARWLDHCYKKAANMICCGMVKLDLDLPGPRAVEVDCAGVAASIVPCF